MSGEVLAYTLAAAASLVTAFVLLRKAPAERNDIKITTADKVNAMTLRFAEKADGDNDDLRAQLLKLRGEFEQYRLDTDARLAEQAAEVRAARAGEAEALRKADVYMERLTKAEGRVTELETEVATLKANGSQS